MCPDVILPHDAEVAELADAPALGAGGRKAVGVQLPPSALTSPVNTKDNSFSAACKRSKLRMC